MISFVLTLSTEAQIDHNDSFEKLYKKYNRLMISVAYDILHNYQDAEDAVIDAFWSIYNRYDAVKELSDSEQRLYCCQAAKSKAINLYNKIKMRTEYEVPLDEQELSYTNKDLEKVCEECESDLLSDMIRKLPDIYQDAMFMYYAQGRPVKDIATELDISNDAVRKRLVRGRSMLIEFVKRGDRL